MENQLPPIFKQRLNEIYQHLNALGRIISKWKFENPIFEEILYDAGITSAQWDYEESLCKLEEEILSHDPVDNLLTPKDKLDQTYSEGEYI